MCGAYRKMIIKVDKLSWTIRKYKELTEDLIQSDLDELEKIELPKEPEGMLVIEFVRQFLHVVLLFFFRRKGESINN